MKYFPRLKVYKNSTNTNWFNPETLEARSYRHWAYLKMINGQLVFNNYMFSNSTAKHQSKLRQLLRELNISIDYFIESPNGLQDLNSAKEYYLNKINNNIKYMKRPRIRQTTKDKLLNLNDIYKAKLRALRELVA
jgi:hypothetical protein